MSDVKVYKAPRLYDARGLVIEFSTPHFVVKSQDFDALTKELEECKAKLKIATEALKTIYIGVDPKNGEWSEQFQDTMLKAFTAKTASDYAKEVVKQLEET